MTQDTAPPAGTQATEPNLQNIPPSPFIGTDITALRDFIRSHAAGSALSNLHFLVVEGQTAATDSFLYAWLAPGAGHGLTIVRLGTAVANEIPIAVEMGTMGADELSGLAGEDGVVRR
jgi:hypothetical protein